MIIHYYGNDPKNEKTACGIDTIHKMLTHQWDIVTCKNCKRHLLRKKRLCEAFGPEAVRLLERR